jgi:molecular chaperone GrpE (heat shock protein)
MNATDVGDYASDRDEDADDVIAADVVSAAATTPEQPISAGHSVHLGGAAEALSEVVARLADDLGAFGRRIDELTRLGEHREQLLDRLHAENQRLRAGEVVQVQAPLLREIIRIYDLVVSLVRDDSPARSDLELVRHRVLDALEQAGVRPLDPEAESPFDASQHAAIKRVETASPELDMTIAHSTRVGFVQDGERVLRPAEVAVHRYRAEPVSRAPASEHVAMAGSED